MKTVLCYTVFCIIGFVLAFFIFRGLLFRFYVPPQEIIDKYKGDELSINVHRATIFLAWFQIAIILAPLSIIFHIFTGKKLKYSAVIVTIIIASLSSLYLAFGTTLDGNGYLYSFIAMFVFGGVGLVIPSIIVKFFRDRNDTINIVDVFD